MKAFTRKKYGGPEVLQLEEVAKPVLKDNHILVKVMANSINPADLHLLRGKPLITRLSLGLFKPKNKILGADFSGAIEETGNGVGSFKVGDHVFGEMLGGAFAEYACIPVNVCAKMPVTINFSIMASISVAGLTAYQALITHGKIKKGESVLINGASGGVGHFAIQIAKAYGAKVTAVCSSRNIAFVQTIGADKVMAYNLVNVHEHNGSYDVIIDIHGNLNHSDYKRMGKRGVMIGFTTMRHMLSVLLKKAFSKFPLTHFTAKANTQDLNILALLVKEGKMKAHIEKTFLYPEIPDAIAHIEQRRTRGKVVMTWSNGH
ncbi:NAD(P)-dependent alcohol dehydrogenase [Maribacter ulvicola]|uniref:NADPH:quinone reductase n=1 Tax=Maribacter ulvicola TaxID=228959 RepID=A0A1N6UP76_9FLAO|nr:NAD(P)-dependent alcohol dehydrogenase [Maribacter ulvicola]SIQ67399.1 NADPH:quinone reductase [Maribacter ulvicola]